MSEEQQANVPRKRGRPRKIKMEENQPDSNELYEKSLEAFTTPPPEATETFTQSFPSITVVKNCDVTAITPSSVPPVSLKRNEYGLLQHISYYYDSLGFIEYKKLLKPEHLVLNRQKRDEIEKIYNKKFNEIDILKDNVDDKYVLILLAGIRYLAMIRGFSSCTFHFFGAENENAKAICTMSFIPNYETNYQPVCFESAAERSRVTTIAPFNNYLISLAENAAFARCVRNFLRIPILANDEILGAKETVQDDYASNVDVTSPHFILQNNLAKYNIVWKQLQAALIKKEENNTRLFPEADKWNTITDIPKKEVLGIIGLLNKSFGTKNGT